MSHFLQHGEKQRRNMLVVLVLLCCFCATIAFKSVRPHRIARLSVRVSASSDVDNELPPVDFDELTKESASNAFVSALDIEELIVKEPRKAPRQAQWFPMLLAPSALDGTYAGDVGFDPLNLAKDKNTLAYMREAEIKHARLAMLAAAGWPMEELWHKNLAEFLELDSILTPNGEAPSLLNGGLDNEFIIGAGVISLLIGGALEFRGKQMSELPGYKAGNLGFDPLNLHSFRASFGIDRIDEKLSREEKIARGKFDMELCEIKNGRAAMIAISLDALIEFIKKSPIVEITPFFFGQQVN